jgi:Protein of unknown function (DUF2795)
MSKVNSAQLEKNLTGVHYPVSKKDLIMYAELEGSDEQVLRALKQLPDKQYETLTALSNAICESEEA